MARRRKSPLGIPIYEPEELEQFIEESKEQFPNRPTHADFLTLSKIITRLDNYVDEHGKDGLLEVVEAVVDPDSIGYLAEQRVLRFQAIAAQNPRRARLLMEWLYREAILVGVHLERARLEEDQETEG
jgi:hypothetical protein